MRKFLALLLVCLLVSAAVAKKSKKEKKAELLQELAAEKERAEKLAEEVEALDEDEDVQVDDKKETKVDGITLKQFDDDDDDEEEEEEEEEVEPPVGKNPCETKKCGRGMECKIVANAAVCECYGKCRKQDARHNVCSKGNETFETECELDRQFCLCSHDLDECKDPKYKTVRLDYFGACKIMPSCLPKQLENFRVRVQEWLFRVMKDLKVRSKIPGYEEWLSAARKEKNHEHAVVWRFCQLDSRPRDAFMSRRELQFTIRSLKGMEQCLVPFLSECDSNSDRKISLEEWETCLGLNKDQVPKHCLPISG